MKYLSGLFLTLFWCCAQAGPYSYECSIKGEYIQTDEGTLLEDSKIYAGQKFSVERKAGVVLGGGVGNSSYPTRQVLDPGGKEQAYKLIWVSKDVVGTVGGKNVVYLSIYEFEEGPSKPFVMIEGSRVLSGVCE